MKITNYKCTVSIGKNIGIGTSAGRREEEEMPVNRCEPLIPPIAEMQSLTLSPSHHQLTSKD